MGVPFHAKVSVGSDRESELLPESLERFRALIANLTDPVAIRVRLLSCARELVAHEGAAVVLSDKAQTRYVVENAEGWASELEGREVGLLS